MGRPLKEKFFGTGSGNQLRVRFHNGTAEVVGTIVKQKATSRFIVKDSQGITKICSLVPKGEGMLNIGEMSISVKDSEGNIKQISKITSNLVTVEGEKIKPWTFESGAETAVEIEEVDTDLFIKPRLGSGGIGGVDFIPASIEIEVSPNWTVGETYTLPVSEVAVTSGIVMYQWQIQTDGVGDFVDMVDGDVVSGSQTNELTFTAVTVDYNGDVVRLVASVENGDDVISNSRTLDVSAGLDEIDDVGGDDIIDDGGDSGLGGSGGLDDGGDDDIGSGGSGGIIGR